jgi:phage-related minor tail protein
MIQIKGKVIEDLHIIHKAIIVWKVSIQIIALKETMILEDLENQSRREKIQTLVKVLNQINNRGSHVAPPLNILNKILNQKKVF